MSTQIQTGSKPQVGYRGFKYNIVYYYGYFPGPVPATGQIVVLFYDDGEGGAAFGGISIDHFNADDVYVGEVVQKIANQNVTITNASEKYNVINGTFTNFQSYSRIDSVTAWGNIDPSGIGGSTNVVYADFGTSNKGTVSSVSAITLGTTGTNITSTVANGTTTPVITLNVPDASSTNRGALTSANWTTFNNKQAALVSGTNLKTINGNSVLGSGDLVVGGPGSGSAHMVYGTTGLQYSNTIVASSMAFGSLATTNGAIGLTPFTPRVTFTTGSFSVLVTAAGGQTGGGIAIYSLAGSQAGSNIIVNKSQQYLLNLTAGTTGIYTVNASFQFNAGVTYWIGYCSNINASSPYTLATYDPRVMLPISSPIGALQYIGHYLTGIGTSTTFPNTLTLGANTISNTISQVWFTVGTIL